MPRGLDWDPDAWDDYQYWLANNKSNARKINTFIKECQREGDGRGTGKAELLKGDLAGWSSKRINLEHRFVYRLSASKVFILSCRDHY